MNINPLWFQHEEPQNKLKLIQILQMGINYSSNLSKSYQTRIDQLQTTADSAEKDNNNKVQEIKQQKRNYQKRKVDMKKMKLKYYDKKVRKMR